MRAFAIIPAAGRSRRMGQPKLLLPWGVETVLERVLRNWGEAGVTRRIVVAHRDDAELIQLAEQAGAIVIAPETPPPQMKDSVLAAIDYLQAHERPEPHDVWLLAPADMPTLSPDVIRTLLSAAADQPGLIHAPNYAARRGHPVVFPWSLTPAVRSLGRDVGVNRLLTDHPVVEISFPATVAPGDLNTPEDYERLRAL